MGFASLTGILHPKYKIEEKLPGRARESQGDPTSNLAIDWDSVTWNSLLVIGILHPKYRIEEKLPG